VYRYVTLDGSVTTQREINLSCMGNVNIRALNALISGLQGVLNATIEGGIGDTDAILKNFLGDTITGFSRNEFRDVSLHIAGKPGDLTFSNVEVQAPVRADALPPALRNPDGYREDRGVKLRFEIPVGPGGEDSHQDNVGNQLSSQILDQLIRGLIFDAE
jgi:translocation and assembly module TamB